MNETGLPLFPILFSIVLEALYRIIRQEKKMKVIQTEKEANLYL